MWKLIDKFVAPAGLFLGVTMLTLGALLMPTHTALADLGGGSNEGSAICVLLCNDQDCRQLAHPCVGGTCSGFACPSWCKCKIIMLGCLCG